MSFLYPWFLLSLLAIAIPILIHLFQFRRYKVVYFANTSFLESLEEESRKQSKLKHLLILMMRILALASLVFAFAGPYKKSESVPSAGENNLVSIYIDNSFSMENSQENQSYLDMATTRAREIASYFSPTDKFQVLTNDLEGKHQRFVSRDEFLQFLNEINISTSATSVNAILKRQSALFAEQSGNNNQVGFIISDFQRHTINAEDWPTDTTTNYFFIPVVSTQKYNISIDSVWIENPLRLANQPITLAARLTNHFTDSVHNIPVRFYINDTQRGVATFSAAAKGSESVVFTFTPSNQIFQNGWVEVSDPTIMFDNTFYFSFTAGGSVDVLSIHQNNFNPYLEALFSADTAINATGIGSRRVDYSILASQNLVILDGIDQPDEGLADEIARYVRQGGNLLLIPSTNSNISAYNRLLQQIEAPQILQKDTTALRLVSIEIKHPLFYGVFETVPENLDYPSVKQHYRFEKRTAGNEQAVISFENGDPFFLSLNYGNGKVFLSSVALDDSFSSFQRNALFVPIIYNTAVQSATFYPLYYTLATQPSIQVRNYQPGSGELFRIISDDLEIIPETRTNGNIVDLFVYNQVEQSGHGILQAGDSIIRFLAFNYNRLESQTEYYTPDQINDLIKETTAENYHILTNENIPITEQINRYITGEFLWKYFVIAALIFVLLEAIILRFLK